MIISDEVRDLVNQAELEVESQLKKIDMISEKNHEKILTAFQDNQVTEVHLNQTTGYGYDDIGREVIEKIFAQIFHTEDAIVRGQFVSGSHALNVTLFAMLRPNDIMLSISGKPYDTLDEVIGLRENKSSLKSFGVKYEQIDLVDNDFDYEKIKERVSKKDIKLIEIQRSRGYSLRKSITLDKIEKVIKTIREVNDEVIIMVDNCYGELVQEIEPTDLGADIVVGSLIKNLGGGIAPNGAYVVGKKEGRDVGPSLGMNRLILQGVYFAPSVVASSVKIAVLTSKVLEKLGYDVEPRWDEDRSDIVQTILFRDREKVIKYCQGIQMGSAVDSNSLPVPGDMPGYEDQVIMAAGAFTQGSSIEFSCDAPLREPFIAFQQGGLTYEYGKIGLMKAVQNLLDK